MHERKMKGAIFDMDGTILDSNGAWDGCAPAMLAHWGYPAKPTLVADVFPLGAWDIVRFLKEDYQMSQSPEEIYQFMSDYMLRFYSRQVQMKPGVRELLTHLKAQGVPLTLATATVKECVLPALELTGLRDVFDHILTCDDVGHSKDEPHIFLEAMDKMGTVPENTWLFEDAIHAIRTGRSLNLVICAIADPAGAPDVQEIREKSDFYLEEWAQWKQIPFVVEK